MSPTAGPAVMATAESAEQVLVEALPEAEGQVRMQAAGEREGVDSSSEQGASPAEPPTSRLSAVLGAILPPADVPACALRLLAHGVTADELLCAVWPESSGTPSHSGLTSVLRAAGMSVGPAMRLAGKMKKIPPPRLPPPAPSPPPPPPPAPAPPPLPPPLQRLPAAESRVAASQEAMAGQVGYVDFRVVVADPQRIGLKTHLIVQSDLNGWGTLGWTATLRQSEEELGRCRAGSRLYVGAWGAHIPNGFQRQAVPVGTHEFVLALSGEADGYGG